MTVTAFFLEVHMEYPRLGDAALIRRRQLFHKPWGRWEEGWHIRKIEHDSITFGKHDSITFGKRRDTLILKNRRGSETSHYDVIVIPPANEWRKFPEIYKLLHPNPNLVIGRIWSGDRTKPAYEIICKKCGEALYQRLISVETAALTFRPDFFDPEDKNYGSGFSQGAPDVEDGGTETVCHCRGKKYELDNYAPYI